MSRGPSVTPQNAVLGILRDHAVQGAEDIAAEILSAVEAAVRLMPHGYRPIDVADEISWWTAGNAGDAQ